MTDTRTGKTSPADVLRDVIRAVRRRYDELHRGQTAPIRRCRTADDVTLEGSYWRIGQTAAYERRHLAHVVLLFPLASQVMNDKFSFGRYLRSHLRDTDAASLRFRRLLDSRDRDELDHRLRGILKLAGSGRAPVDWGILGTDILWFFADSDNVRRRWAEGFYAPIVAGASASGSTPSTSLPVNAQLRAED